MLKRFFSRGLIEAGCDEAGRGCLAGPVVAAAVILPPKIRILGIDDSKKLSRIQREKLEPRIRAAALDFGIGIADHLEIDDINILQASLRAMHRALDALQTTPQLILVDGNRFNPYRQIPHQTIVKGDATYLSIAAASILAKVARDRLMEKLHSEFPFYGWNQNMGYPTEIHRKAVKRYGISPVHRKTFSIKPLLSHHRLA